MLTIHQSATTCEVREGDKVVEKYPLKPFEDPISNLGILKAIELVRKLDYNNATYYDFSQIIIYT